jgi:Prolyl oligopeptidase family
MGFELLNREDIKKLPSRPATAKIAYGEAPQQFAELRLPEGRGLFPVIAILHGGCWIGYAGVEYRRGHEPGGGWPGTFEDAERVDALREAAAKYRLDLTRVVLVGHSAGGQLALYVGSRLKLPAISLAGIVDMRAYAKCGPKHYVDGQLQVMGGTPEEHPDRYAKVSPAQLLPLGIPHVLIWGELDDVRVPGAGHHEFGSAEGPAWNAILAAISRLMKLAAG